MLLIYTRAMHHGPTVEVLHPRQDREWGLATRRQNVAVLARLRPTSGDSGAFCVGVYHMPCLFRSTEERQTQNIHILALQGALATMTNNSKEPCVLLGDFNIKPGGSGYNLLRGVGLGHEEAPDTAQYRRIYDEFPLTSAYFAFHGTESSPWTLDYIWMSNGCRVLECPKLDPATPMPSASEPSDHPIVEAVVELPIDVVELAFDAHQSSSKDFVSVKKTNKGYI